MAGEHWSHPLAPPAEATVDKVPGDGSHMNGPSGCLNEGGLPMPPGDHEQTQNYRGAFLLRYKRACDLSERRVHRWIWKSSLRTRSLEVHRNRKKPIDSFSRARDSTEEPNDSEPNAPAPTSLAAVTESKQVPNRPYNLPNPQES